MRDSLKKMCEAAKAADLNLYSICEICNGVSETADLVPASNCHNSYSVSKAFCVTAIGMLEDRGILNTDDLVYPILEKKFPAGFDEKWKKVTIAHVLTHTIGFEHGFLDIDCEYVPDYPTTDFLSMVLQMPLRYEPGEKFVYSDAAFYLASRIFSEKTGEMLDDFLRRELFVPMQFREYAWSKCPSGYTIGATGLYITTTDMAKLGQMYLQKGIYGGKRFLSEQFVEKTLGKFELTKAPYGGFAKGGMLGQYLYLNPGEQRVIAFHGIIRNASPATILLDAVHG